MVEETIEIDLSEQSLPNLIIYCHYLLKYDNRISTITVRIFKKKNCTCWVCVYVCEEGENIARVRKTSIIYVLTFSHFVNYR